MWRSEGPCSGVNIQHEGNLKKLAGYPIHTLTVQLARIFQYHHYNPGFIQGVAIVNDYSH